MPATTSTSASTTTGSTRTPDSPDSTGSTVARALRLLRGGETGLLALAVAVGVGAGLGAVVFRWLVVALTRALSGHKDYSALGRVANPHVPWLGPWFLLLAPVVAGLVYGPLVYFFAREARGHGVPEVMVAVARNHGRIKPQVAVVKALASALTIGGGGSVGREGPIVQIGSALGSTLGRITGVSEQRTKVLVACGAAGGIAATFNAPLAGVFFAMELILIDFGARSFGMVVVSSVTASVIGRTILGNHPFLSLATYRVEHVDQYVLFAVLGLLAGLVGVVFTRVLYAIEDACDWLWRGPEWLRPAAGGVVLGAILLALPQMYGVGYPVLDRSVLGDYGIGFLLLLLVGKIVATSVSIGIGGSGGVFAPSLFMGAALGAAFGQAAHAIDPGFSGPPGVYALIGMGAVFAGAARAPITAVVILFELTGEYTLILPLMTAIVLSTGLSHLVSRDSIYTLKLRRRGIDMSEPPQTARLRTTLVRDVMEPVAAGGGRAAVIPVGAADGSEATADGGVVLEADDDLATALEILTSPGVDDAVAYRVRDADGAVVGTLTFRHLVAVLREPGPA